MLLNIIESVTKLQRKGGKECRKEVLKNKGRKTRMKETSRSDTIVNK